VVSEAEVIRAYYNISLYPRLPPRSASISFGEIFYIPCLLSNDIWDYTYIYIYILCALCTIYSGIIYNTIYKNSTTSTCLLYLLPIAVCTCYRWLAELSIIRSNTGTIKSDRRTMVHCKGGTLNVGIAHLEVYNNIITANSSRITVQLLLWWVIISFTFLLLLRVVTCERVWWWQLYSVTALYIK